MGYLPPVLLLAVSIVFQIFGPAMAAFLPLSFERRKLAWILWIASILGGIVTAFTTLMFQDLVQHAEDLDPLTKAFASFPSSRTMTSELILRWLPAVVALGFWVKARPKKPASFWYKVFVLATVYLLPITVSYIYSAIVTKGGA